MTSTKNLDGLRGRTSGNPAPGSTGHLSVEQRAKIRAERYAHRPAPTTDPVPADAPEPAPKARTPWSVPVTDSAWDLSDADTGKATD